MNESGKAVFVSYASQDSDAARRICEALRAAGVEVWFDREALRGGDQWDARIREQIRTCALFIPVVSERTEERTEGYFRREWKLAVDRTQDMAGGRAFLVPVVIDATSEAGAAVPEEFRRYQWTRLPGGEGSREFVAHIKRLLDSSRRPDSQKDQAGLPGSAPLPPASRGSTGAQAAQRRSNRAGIWIAGVVIGLALVAAVWFGRDRPPSPRATNPPAAPVPSAAPSPTDDRSIAVLPFINMSDDKDSGYFADGVHEDVLTNLARIAQLKVIARTSVMEYRDTTKKVPQIARELGVGYILEGSVRRAGNRVRVVCQLVDGRTGQHVLAPEPYDRDLADIFAIQSEIAQSIAAKLQAVLAPKEKEVLERAPTANLAAYDLYLKAREIMDREPDQRLRASRAQALLESALQYDAEFAQAWFGLGMVHLGAYYRFDQTENRRRLAKSAIDKARALAPDDGNILALETNYFIDVRDLSRARELATRLEREHPSLAVTYHVLARLDLRDEHPREALQNYRKARNLDPRNATVVLALVAQLRGARRYEEATAVLVESDEIVRADPFLEWVRVLIPYEATGSTREIELLRGQVTPAAERGDKTAISFLAGIALLQGDAAEVIRLWERHGEGFGLIGGGEQFAIATALVATGQLGRARPILLAERERYRERLVSRPDNIENWSYLAATFALLGDKEGTFAVKREMLAANPGLSGRGLWRFEEHLLLAWLGEKEAALDELAARLADGRIMASVHVMRTSLRSRPFHGDPRFEAMLSDPKNRAPLF